MKNCKFQSLQKKGVFLLVLGLTFGLSYQVHGKEPSANSLSDPLEIQIEIEGLKKQFPTIILVDKDLKVKAEFYGSREIIKKEFESTFEKTELLLEHNSHRIYLITK